MLRTSVVSKGKGFKSLQTNIQRYPQRFNAVAQTVFYRQGFQADLLAGLRKQGPKPRGKINWDSPKQQAAFFASNGFGGGIPHVRTGRTVEQSATAELVGSGSGLTVNAGYNNDKAVYVRGPLSRGSRKRQSNIHKGRHPLVEPFVERWRTRYINRVIAVLPSVFEATGAR